MSDKTQPKATPELELEADELISLEEAMRRRDLVRSLMTHPGWGFVKDLFAMQRDARVKQIYQPSNGVDGVLLKEYMSGVAAAFELAITTPEVLNDHYTELVKELAEAAKDQQKDDAGVDSSAEIQKAVQQAP